MKIINEKDVQIKKLEDENKDNLSKIYSELNKRKQLEDKIDLLNLKINKVNNT